MSDRRRIRAALPGHDRSTRPLAPLPELLYGRRPEGVCGGEHRVARQEVDQLANSRGLARAVDADHQDHGRPVRDVQLDRAFEHTGGMLYKEPPELLAARDFLLERLLPELPDELRRGRDPHVESDEYLLDPLPELLVPCIPEPRHARVELPDNGLPAPPESPPQPSEPPAGSVLAGRRLDDVRLAPYLLRTGAPLRHRRFGDGGGSDLLRSVPGLGGYRRASLTRFFCVLPEKLTPRVRHRRLLYSPCTRFDTTVVAPEASWITP